MNNLIIFTGQSGIKAAECLSKIDCEYVPLDSAITRLSGLAFIDFLSSAQKLQYKYWTGAFKEILENKLAYDSEQESQIKTNIFFYFHASYFHQIKQELFPLINFKEIANLSGKAKMVIVLIDDIFDIFRRLMATGQMFEDLNPQGNAENADPLDAIFSSVFNIITLLRWREMEISISRLIANYLDIPFFVFSTKYPQFMLKRLVEADLDKMKVYYLSHHITAIRKQPEWQRRDFTGRLNELIRHVNAADDVMLFYPTAIDELIIERIGTEAGKWFYFPNLIQRWPNPYDGQQLCPHVDETINPLNPLNLECERDESNPINRSISSLLSLLWDLIYKTQTISRDLTMVEQCKSGVIAIRPHYAGSTGLPPVNWSRYNESLKMAEEAKEARRWSNESVIIPSR